ncbi:MAG TPA: AcvB/VirJ family lysyl-phosphatidylglycerol hydrolase [Acidobacteriota bacterium]|nr:AcvB/VirJ family lysyl-phosphatidylglycerol hydrolase [Acidobacteriota bacterium]
MTGYSFPNYPLSSHRRHSREIGTRLTFPRIALVVVVALTAMLPPAVDAAQGVKRAPQETLRYENFGTVHIYRKVPYPANVVVFFSGESGWNEQAASMASAFTSLNSLVIGINTPHYLRSLVDDGEQCSYYASDLEDLSHYVQQKLGFPSYMFPIGAGYSSGAALAYAASVQAPTGTLRGAISLGFCPNVRLPKPPCRASGLEWNTAGKARGAAGADYLLQPAHNLAIPWIVLQGDSDKACDPNAVASFVRQTGHARLVNLPGVGRGYTTEAGWMPRLKAEYASLLLELEERSASPKAPEVKDLPLVEIPASGPSGDALAVVISGDGGWAGIDRGIGQTLAVSGISVVGLNSLQYFWKRRTPESAAADLKRILMHYLAAWNKRTAILIGYSMGADVLPFMTARLPADLLSRVRLVALLGLSATVDFEFHFAAWFGKASRMTDLRVAPEVEKLKGLKILCIYGIEEVDSLCRGLPAGLVQPIAMKDGHHFGGDYKSVAEVILKQSK